MRFNLLELKNAFFSNKFSNKQIVFNALCILGSVSTIITVLVSLNEKSFRLQNIFYFVFVVFLMICFYVGNVKKKLTLASAILICGFSFVLFPFIYFFSGGYRSGVAVWFSLAIIFSCLVLEGVTFFAVLFLQVVTVFTCYLFEYFHVISPMPIESEFLAFKHNLKNLLIVAFVICVINMIQNVMYKNNMRVIELRNKALEKSERKAEKANNAKTDFLSNMSHEIRTPINSILGMNEMILREARDKQILEYASAIQTSGNALLSLINDILDLSKIESGKIEIINEQYKLSDLVLDSYGMIEERLEKKGLKGSIFCNENLPSVLVGDEVHIRQILINFLTNSVKYTEKGNVDFFILGSVADGKAKLIFSVKDTGIGIKKENLANMFKKFERFELQRNRNIEGSGLGLSISKQLADLMGATIEVKSEYGKGSEFIFTITQKVLDSSPVGEVSPKKKAADTEVVVYHQLFEAPDAQILAVDDVELNLIVFENLLKETKIKMDFADNGYACLEKAKSRHYDMIFMDYMMPDMDGIETLKKVREEAILNFDTPVVVLTADALAGVREKYMAAGFADYVSKPIDGKNLEKVLVKHLPKEKIYYTTEFGKKNINCGERISKLINSLSEFDFEAALSYCDDSEKFCVEIISDYCTNNHLKELEHFFEECEWENYKRILFTLKGTTKTIGLQTLSDEFKLQESAVEKCELDFARKNHKKLMDHYENCIAKMTDAGFFKKQSA